MATERMELVDVTGPIGSVPTGRVNRRTGDPILRKCTPYRVVRVMVYRQIQLNDCLSRPGDVATSCVLRDIRRGSEAEARRLADSLPRYVG